MKRILQIALMAAPVASSLLHVAASSAAGTGQGMISGSATARPRPKFSGRSWPVTFVDTAATAGIDMKFTSGAEGKKKLIIEANGSGVAFLDYNNDGRTDVFLVNGSRLEGFPSGHRPTNYLYRNDGKGRFVDVSTAARVDSSGWGNGVCAGDFDNDGNLDLYVTYWGPNRLYHNRGDGTFSDVAAAAHLAGPKDEWSTGCTFVDYDRDGQLDLLVTSYVGFDPATTPGPGAHPFCTWKGHPVYCGPRGLPPGKVTLYHNVGGGRFEDVSLRSGVRDATNCYGFTALSADLNGDGWPDVYVACDSTPSLYFRNEKNGTFREIGTEAGVAYSGNGSEQAGMGVAIGDFDNDGRLDLLKTNFIGDYPNLYRNFGRGLFDDTAIKAGLAVNPDHVLWGTGLVDLDNDGWKDIVQVSGHVYPEVSQIDSNEKYESPRLVYRNLGAGKFEDVSALSGPGILQEQSSRGAAFGDFDNDGDIDVLIMNMNAPPSLLRNDLKSDNHWIELLLRGTKSNRAAIGATVWVKVGDSVQASVVTSQSSFLSHNDLRLHFGLGGATRVDAVTVQWPSGETETFPAADAGALYSVVEESGAIKRLALPQ